jgi:hypothetical protein
MHNIVLLHPVCVRINKLINYTKTAKQNSTTTRTPQEGSARKDKE